MDWRKAADPKPAFSSTPRLGALCTGSIIESHHSIKNCLGQHPPHRCFLQESAWDPPDQTVWTIKLVDFWLSMEFVKANGIWESLKHVLLLYHMSINHLHRITSKSSVLDSLLLGAGTAALESWAMNQGQWRLRHTPSCSKGNKDENLCQGLTVLPKIPLHLDSPDATM